MIATTLDTLLAVGRSIELTVLLKATVILAIGVAAAQLASRARASFRHLLLAVTFAALAALPFIIAAAPPLTIQVPVARASQAIDPAQTSGTAPIAPGPAAGGRDGRAVSGRELTDLSWPALARWVWIGGAGALCLSLLMAIVRVSRIRRHGVPRPELSALVRGLALAAGVRRPVEVLEHEDLLAPLTCGLWQPAILLPVTARDWTAEDVRRALVHELEHVRRADWMVHLAARVVCAGYWFHPLAWIALRRMCLEAERACDDAVVRESDRADYADQLVLLARQLSARHAPAIVGMANRSDLAARVAALLDDRQLRGRAGRLAAGGAVAAAILTVTTIASVRAVEPVSTDTTRRPASASNTTASTTSSGEQRAPQARGLRVRAIDRALYEAAADGDLDEIDQLLRAGADVNAAISGDGTPLIGAARGGHVDAVRLLLDRGADVNLAVSGDGNPLIMAAREGETAVVELLLARNAAVDQAVPGDETALIQASGEGHLGIVKLLVSRGANVNLGMWVDESGPRAEREWRSPLSMARRGRHAAVVGFLVSAGARE